MGINEVRKEISDINIPEDMRGKIKGFIEDFVDADETCQAVKDHLKHKKPSGTYFALAKYFKDEKENHSFTDVCYKMWLKNLIDNGREKESIVLSCLKEEYEKKYQDKDADEAKAKIKEELRSFVFLVHDEKPELNQKWHFLISYWGYIEFITLFKIDNKIRSLYERTKIGNAFLETKRSCPELRIWYETCAPTKTKNSK